MPAAKIFACSDSSIVIKNIMDVVVEAYLLSETSVFVHGNSNIVNFVLCKNPTLHHKYVYG